MKAREAEATEKRLKAEKIEAAKAEEKRLATEEARRKAVKDYRDRLSGGTSKAPLTETGSIPSGGSLSSSTGTTGTMRVSWSESKADSDNDSDEDSGGESDDASKTGINLKKVESAYSRRGKTIL